ncbi:MAG: carbohydrate porin [Candidatus Latescibacteria bacterium]|nr:carbohydrate porin [Candidatus Latescibacterota bacterium]
MHRTKALGRWLFSGMVAAGIHSPLPAQTNDELLQAVRRLRAEQGEPGGAVPDTAGRTTPNPGALGAPTAAEPASAPAAPAPAAAPDAPLPGLRERSVLLGEDRQGVVVGAIYTGEVVRNLAGGIARKGTYLDNFDLSADLDLEKLLGWQGTTAFVYALGNNGGDPTAFIGDAQGSSNIETADTWKLYEAWIEKVWGGGRTALRLGLNDLNCEFDVKEYGGLFLNSSHGIGADFSQSGVNGPSIFPTASLGARLRLHLVPTYYLQLVVLDGVPGDPDDPTGTHVSLSTTDGALVALEGGRTVGGDEQSYGKWGVGMWGYTAAFEAIDEVDAAGNPVKKRGNMGLYAFAESELVREQDPDQGLGGYVRIGIANPRFNQFGLFAGGGLVYSGPFDRAADQVGLGVALAVNGGDFKDANPGAERAETNIELSYRLQLMPWLAVQPDLQYILDPGTDPGCDNAAVFACRFETAF